MSDETKCLLRTTDGDTWVYEGPSERLRNLLDAGADIPVSPDRRVSKTPGSGWRVMASSVVAFCQEEQ